ncbi:DeoR family transcriptional regulator [Kordiimonas sp. SCSIO 12610]|uniref:DeoR family transcriptional regulator n=1 Tax=Kordiimonas sp. SCSIO 12610 TaxID=2829597 RepID=UPI00210862C1|nr:DeoR family transcriptional regulator [Kordiimonas sp. SCSIO 12610]UTW54780.1 DeoR family transcriptional regulator [Kordiimonas sp. SCSIO 12610]
MPKKEKNLSARQKEILDLVQEHGFIATEQMVKHFGVTPQTIRRDINSLCDLKLLQRFHGGASTPGNTQNTPYLERANTGFEAKQRIAKMAAKLIPNGSSLFLNIGTTPEAVAMELKSHKDLRIVTNNINIANMLRQNASFDVMIAGGLVRHSDGGIVGEATTDFINQFRLDIGVLGISGIDRDGTLLDFDYQEIRSAQAIIKNSKQVFMVADHNKFGRRAMIRMGNYSDIDHLFTDIQPPSDFIEAIEASEMKLHVAGGL